MVLIMVWLMLKLDMSFVGRANPKRMHFGDGGCYLKGVE